MKNALSDSLQIWGFQDDSILFADGSMGFALELIPIDVTCWSTEQINEFSSKAAQFLNGLADKIDIQFVQDIVSGNSELILKHQQGAQDSKDPVVTELTTARVARLNQLDDAGLLPKHTLKVFVRKAAQRALLERPKFFSKAKPFQPIADERLRVELSALSRLKADLHMGFEQLGLKAHPIGTESVMDLIYAQWNPTRDIPRGSFDPDDVRSSVLFTDVGINDRGFSMGDMHYRVVSLKLLPDQTFAAMAANLRSLPFDSRLMLSIHVPNQQAELETLQVQRRIAFSMIAGSAPRTSIVSS